MLNPQNLAIAVFAFVILVIISLMIKGLRKLRRRYGIRLLLSQYRVERRKGGYTHVPFDLELHLEDYRREVWRIIITAVLTVAASVGALYGFNSPAAFAFPIMLAILLIMSGIFVVFAGQFGARTVPLRVFQE